MLTDLEKALLASECGADAVDSCICVGRGEMRIDAGHWWRGTPLRTCIVGNDLVLLAVARRRYIEKVPLADCQESRYCPDTGELILAPIETLAYRAIRMSPRDALEVLRRIRECCS